VGRRSDEDLFQAPGGVTSSRVVVTSKRVLGKTVRELGLDHFVLFDQRNFREAVVQLGRREVLHHSANRVHDVLPVGFCAANRCCANSAPKMLYQF
jgi:hypothetical protein